MSSEGSNGLILCPNWSTGTLFGQEAAILGRLLSFSGESRAGAAHSAWKSHPNRRQSF